MTTINHKELIKALNKVIDALSYQTYYQTAVLFVNDTSKVDYYLLTQNEYTTANIKVVASITRSETEVSADEGSDTWAINDESIDSYFFWELYRTVEEQFLNSGFEIV